MQSFVALDAQGCHSSGYLAALNRLPSISWHLANSTTRCSLTKQLLPS